MTPQAIGELIDARQQHDAAPRHDLAIDTLSMLRRQHRLAEPGAADLPPHPDIPERGEWMRQMIRRKGRDDVLGKVWHLYSGRWWESGGRVYLGASCGRKADLYDAGRLWRRYVDRRTEQPPGACQRCRDRIIRVQDEVQTLERLYVAPSAELERLVGLARKADSAGRYTDEELRAAAEAVLRDKQAGRDPLDGFMQ